MGQICHWDDDGAVRLCDAISDKDIIVEYDGDEEGIEQKPKKGEQDSMPALFPRDNKERTGVKVC